MLHCGKNYNKKSKNLYFRWNYAPQIKRKVQNFGVDVKRLAGLESPNKQSIFGNAKSICYASLLNPNIKKMYLLILKVVIKISKIVI